MRITDIKRQVKRNDRYSIYLDRKYIFSLSDSELLTLGLRVGQEITEDELHKLKSCAVLDKAYDSALNYVLLRPHSEWELKNYLKRKELTDEVIEPVLNRLREKGYADDESFARRWIENRRLLKTTSKRRLRQELQQKRVQGDIIDQALQEDETDEQALLVDLISRKRQQSKYKDNLKLMQYLARQGYAYDDIKAALSRVD